MKIEKLPYDFTFKESTDWFQDLNINLISVRDKNNNNIPCVYSDDESITFKLDYDLLDEKTGIIPLILFYTIDDYIVKKEINIEVESYIPIMFEELPFKKEGFIYIL